MNTMDWDRNLLYQTLRDAENSGYKRGKLDAAAAEKHQPTPIPVSAMSTESLLRSINDTLYRIEKILTMTGHKTKLPNARLKDGKLEIDKPRSKLPPHIAYAKANKRKIRRGRRT